MPRRAQQLARGWERAWARGRERAWGWARALSRRRGRRGLEGRDGHGQLAAVGRDGDARRPALEGRRAHLERVRPGVDGDRDAPLGARHVDAVARHLEAVDGLRHGDREPREVRRERLGMPLRSGHVLGATARVRRARRLAVRRPRGRCAPELLVAVGEVQERAGRRVEALAVGELGARFGDLSLGHQRSLARRAPRRRPCPRSTGRSRSRQRGRGPPRTPRARPRRGATPRELWTCMGRATPSALRPERLA